MSELADRCRAVLEASHAEGERRGVRYSYTGPSPSRYPWQWYWDSCFAAIVWRRFDPSARASELESLLNAMRADGFIGHVVFWDQPLELKRLVYYNVTSRHAEMTGTIQPPLLAWAWRIAVGDPADRAADRHPPRVAAREPRPRRRRPAVAGAARRVGARLVAEVRPGLGPARHGGYGFPLLVARNRGWAGTPAGSATAAGRCSAR